MKLLYAEDEPAMSEAVVAILEYHGFFVDAVATGDDALAYALLEPYDGIILDIMLPGKDGLEVLKELRERGVCAPVLLLTARSEVDERIAGLDAGADDYLPKPFVMGELIARVRAMLRRREVYTPDVLAMGNALLDTTGKTLTVAGTTVQLSKIEYQLMELLMLHQGAYLSSEQILERVWGCGTEVELGTVWVYISYLRKKLGALGANIGISSRRNIGYALEAAV